MYSEGPCVYSEGLCMYTEGPSMYSGELCMYSRGLLCIQRGQGPLSTCRAPKAIEDRMQAPLSTDSASPRMYFYPCLPSSPFRAFDPLDHPAAPSLWAIVSFCTSEADCSDGLGRWRPAGSKGSAELWAADLLVVELKSEIALNHAYAKHGHGE